MPDTRMRIALTVPSAASLGAYEAGATAGLVVALQRLSARAARSGRRPAAVVDAVGAASAGTLVAVLATRCLLGGLDPVHVLHRASVEEASWRKLRRRAGDAPLSLDSIEPAARSLLDPRDRRGRPTHRVASGSSGSPLVLRLDVAALQGLAFPVRGRGQPVAGFTHVDSSEFVLGPQDDAWAWTSPPRRSPLDVALAAMSHPAVFAPRLLDRRGERDRYAAAGIQNVPESGHLWCGDGGALVRSPLGAALSAARRADELRRGRPGAGEGVRVHLLVQPHSTGPDADGQWTDPAVRPAWPAALARAVASLSPEALYADQRAVSDVNRRLQLAEQLCDALVPLLPAQAGTALATVLGQPFAADGEAGDVRALLERTLAEVGALEDKVPVATEVISPLRLVEDGDRHGGGITADQPVVPRLLAGEFLARFGGLLDRDVRHSDFVTGWRSTRAWLPDALSRYEVEDADVRAAVDALDERQIGYGTSGFRGGTTLSDLPLHARAQLARTVVHAARIAVGAAVRSRPRSSP